MTKKPMTYDIGEYASLSDIFVALSKILEPPERLTVSQWAERYRYVNNRGSYVGYWKNSTTPYMVEPMDMLCSPVHDGVIVVAPAQCGKTDALIVNWTGYSIASDPMDMLIFNPTSNLSRDFSKRRVDKLLRDTKECGSLLNKDRHADNIGDKHFQNGVFLSMAHPSVSEMAGRPVPRVALTDYDRMDDDIGGDGSPYDLASKRTTTFGSYRMCLAESSPSRPIEDRHWVAVDGSHEAPPTKGIFSLYNRGDRRRWYWACQHCQQRFEGTFDLLKWNEKATNMVDIADSVYMQCPKCFGRIEQSQRHEMQQTGVWVQDGMYFNFRGELVGSPRKTRIASFWLRGVAAAFVSWGQLVTMYLAAEEEYKSTGSEESLQKFFNTDLAEPYIPKSLTAQRLPEHLRDRAVDIGEKVVPEGVRALVANVDVQKDRFVVQVHGISMGAPFDITIIDRFEIRKSRRIDEDGDYCFLQPHAYLEDWDLIEDLVMNKRYPLADGSNREMGVLMTTCDSGGYSRKKGESVTNMAYDFHRSLRKRGLSKRFHLVKGTGAPNAPRANITYPDATKKDNLNAARGDVPVLILNSNFLKDVVSNRLDVTTPANGLITFPDWLPISFYQELCAETRKPNGWEKVATNDSNEAWDLLYYCVGACVSKLLKVDLIDWSKPPVSFEEWDKNPLVYSVVANDDETSDNVAMSDNVDTSVGRALSWDEINNLQG